MDYVTADMSAKIEPGGPEYAETVERLRAYARSLTFRERVGLVLEIARRPGKFNHYGRVQLEILRTLLDDPGAAIDVKALQD